MTEQPQVQQAPQQQEPEVTLTLKVSQVNIVLAGLDEVPHKFSRPVIDLIAQQVQGQLQSRPQGPLTNKVLN